VIGLDGRLATSFTAGLLAAVNPCGFVLLPTYLLYFLGMENLRPGEERSSVRRALAVSVAVSAGFMTVFVIIGTIVKLSSNWLVEKASWLSLAFGIAMIALGVAMLFGYRLPLTAPKLDLGSRERDRTVTSMYLFGIVYAIASMGCTIPTFLGVVLGAFSTDGIGTGISAIALYGLGMGILVTGLTVTLAFANTALLRVLRSGMGWFEYVSGVFMLLTGAYLSWYWYSSLSDNYDSRVIDTAESWQVRLQNWIDANQSAVVIAALVAIAAAVAVSLRMKRAATTS
jgi:cytochrome c biogenesis protein CcdA